MWECIKCREQVEDDFDVCWSCGTSQDGTEDPDFRKVDDAPAAELTEPHRAEMEQRKGNPLFCPRCDRQLDFVGTKKFHEGTRTWDLMGGIWELFKNREHFDVYMCPRCGRVEFFIDGVGEEYRPH